MALEYKEEVSNFSELFDVCWGDALTVLNKIEEEDRKDEAWDIINEYNNMHDGSIPTLEQLNDFIHHDLDGIMGDLWD